MNTWHDLVCNIHTTPIYISYYDRLQPEDGWWLIRNKEVFRLELKYIKIQIY